MINDETGFMGTEHDAADEIAEIEFIERAKQDTRDAGLRALADLIRAPYGKTAIAFHAFALAFTGKPPGYVFEKPAKLKQHFRLHSDIHRGMAIHALRERVGNEPDKQLQREMFLLLESLKEIEK